METEIWKSIIGFEGIYEVSDFGNVRSVKRGANLSFGKHNRGYVMASLNKNGYRKNCTVHRLVAIAFIPNPNNLPEVNHKDGNKGNNHVLNLEWASKKEQMRHAFDTGLMDNAKLRAASRMKEIGTTHAKSNVNVLAEYHQRKFTKVAATGPDSKRMVFESFRQLEKETGLDRKAASKHLGTGNKLKGYLIETA